MLHGVVENKVLLRHKTERKSPVSCIIMMKTHTFREKKQKMKWNSMRVCEIDRWWRPDHPIYFNYFFMLTILPRSKLKTNNKYYARDMNIRLYLLSSCVLFCLWSQLKRIRNVHMTNNKSNQHTHFNCLLSEFLKKNIFYHMFSCNMILMFIMKELFFVSSLVLMGLY